MSFPWQRESRGLMKLSGFPIKLGMTKESITYALLMKFEKSRQRKFKRYFRIVGKVKDRLYRFFTVRNRVLPDYIIIGAQKSGTTSLYHCMTQHPQILPAFRKEIHYFDTKFNKGILWYRSNFPTKSKFAENTITGEASPEYLFHPNVPERMVEIIPNVKLIMLLRNPADRAISHYYHYVSNKKEHLPIEEAFRIEEQRIKPAFEKLMKRRFFVKKYSMKYRRFSYKIRGIYINQISNYLKYFKRSQMFIEASEIFFKNPLPVLKNIFEFLNVDPDFIPEDIRPKQVGNYPEVNKKFYEKLQEYFKPYNKKLYDFLNRDFDWDK